MADTLQYDAVERFPFHIISLEICSLVSPYVSEIKMKFKSLCACAIFSKLISLTGLEQKKKWRSLRDTYVRKRRQIRTSKSGQAAGKAKKWPCSGHAELPRQIRGGEQVQNTNKTVVM